MGSNSNRGPSRSEKIGYYAEEISRTRDISSSEFQFSTGARIRGEMGVERGNAFIKAIKDASR